MSNIIVTTLLCAILKAVKPEIDPQPLYVTITASVIIDCFKLIHWIDSWRDK